MEKPSTIEFYVTSGGCIFKQEKKTVEMLQ
jgi:soluble P-type ATPase